jgi:hypothetical protein
MAKPKKMPMGIVILSLLAAFAGIATLVWGFRLIGWLVLGPMETGDGTAIAGIASIVVGAVLLAAGGALAAYRPWALALTQILALVGILNAVFTMFATGEISSGIGQLILPGILLWYTNRTDIVQAFGLARD